MSRSTLTSFPGYLFSALLILVLVTNVAAAWQRSGAEVGQIKLKRAYPDGWFSFLVPTIMGTVERHADVDGGLYLGDELEINYDYWTFENTPNFRRDVNGNYLRRPVLVCSRRAVRVHTYWTTLDGRRGVIQRCSQVDGRRGWHHIYHVSFPNVRVSDGHRMKKGIFNLTIVYKDERYLWTAQHIVRSIDF